MTRTAFGIPEQIFINNEGVFGNKAFDKFKSLESRTNIEPDDFTYYGKDIPTKEGRGEFADAVGNHLKSVTSGLDNKINDIVEKLKSIEVTDNNKKKSTRGFSFFSNNNDDDDDDDDYGGGRRRRKRKSRRRRRKSMKKSRKSRKSRGRKRKSRRRTRRRH